MLNFIKLKNKSENEGQKRYRKAFLTSISGVLSQLIQLATGLISVPLTLNYIGTERFGLWMTLSTALTFISFSDLGIGIGTQNKISIYYSNNNLASAKKSFLSSLALILLLFSFFLIINYTLVPKINLSNFLKLKLNESINEIIPTTQMVIFILGLGLISGIIQRVFDALQEGYWVKLILILTRLLSFALLFIAVNLKLGLPALVFIIGGISNAGIIIIGTPLLFIKHRWLIPSFNFSDNFDYTIIKSIIKIGLLGLGASVAVYLVNSYIPVLIANKYGAENVTDYAVTLKLVSIPTILLTFLLLPLWPAITDANQKNDILWIKNTYKKCAYIVLIISILSVALFLLLGQKIIFLWTNNMNTVPSFPLLLACVSFMVISFWNTLTTLILNGLSKFKGQATYGLFLALLFSIAASFVLNNYEKHFIIWTITLGFFIRCVFLQIEVNNAFKHHQLIDN